MEIVWSETALKHVGGIIDYIARDDYDTALKWATELQDNVETLRFHPKAGRSVSVRKNCRQLIFGNYRITYRVFEQRCEILAVMHTRQR